MSFILDGIREIRRYFSVPASSNISVSIGGVREEVADVVWSSGKKVVSGIQLGDSDTMSMIGHLFRWTPFPPKILGVFRLECYFGLV